MTDGLLLFVTLVVLYLLECVLWVPLGFLELRQTRSGQTHLTRGSVALGKRVSALLQSPAPPLGRSYVAGPLPLSLSPKGICDLPAMGPFEAWNRFATVLRFDEIKDVRAVGTALEINGRRFTRLRSYRQASSLSRVIADCRKADEATRETIVGEALGRSVRAPRAKARARAAWRRTTELRSLCNVLFVHLFVVCPVAAFLFGLTATFWSLALIAVGLSLITTLEGWLAHRALFPSEVSSRVQTCLTSSICPPVAARFADLTLGRALAEFDPLVVFAALGTPELLRSFAEKTVRRLRHAPIPTFPGEPCLEIVRWHRGRMQSAYTEALAGLGVEVEKLLRAPERSGRAVAFCPCCLTQYVGGQCSCRDCGGVVLQRFERSEAAV